MKVADRLKQTQQKLVICSPDDLVKGAAARLNEGNIGAMPVCERENVIIGIISERDIVRSIGAQCEKLAVMKVREIMSGKVISCTPEDSMTAVQKLMDENRIRHVPVVVNGNVIAMLSIRDMLAARLQESRTEVEILRDAVIAARYR